MCVIVLRYNFVSFAQRKWRCPCLHFVSSPLLSSAFHHTTSSLRLHSNSNVLGTHKSTAEWNIPRQECKRITQWEDLWCPERILCQYSSLRGHSEGADGFERRWTDNSYMEIKHHFGGLNNLVCSVTSDSLVFGVWWRIWAPFQSRRAGCYCRCQVGWRI